MLEIIRIKQKIIENRLSEIIKMLKIIITENKEKPG